MHWLGDATELMGGWRAMLPSVFMTSGPSLSIFTFATAMVSTSLGMPLQDKVPGYHQRQWSVHLRRRTLVLHPDVKQTWCRSRAVRN